MRYLSHEVNCMLLRGDASRLLQSVIASWRRRCSRCSVRVGLNMTEITLRWHDELLDIGTRRRRRTQIFKNGGASKKEPSPSPL